LHLHIVDMNALGPSFWKLEFKNCPLDAVIKVLHEEVGLAPPISMVAVATTSAIQSAMAATRAAEDMAKQVATQAPFTRRAAMSSLLCNNRARIITLNVTGEIMTVRRETLLLAPDGSLLKSMFGDEFSTTIEELDIDGHIFLNFPPKSFRLIVSHLQLLHLTPPGEMLDPPTIPQDLRQEFAHLAWLLGVEEFFFLAQHGKGAMDTRRLLPRVPAVFMSKPHQQLMDPRQGIVCGSNNDLHYIPEAQLSVCDLCFKKQRSQTG